MLRDRRAEDSQRNCCPHECIRLQGQGPLLEFDGSCVARCGSPQTYATPAAKHRAICFLMCATRSALASLHIRTLKATSITDVQCLTRCPS